MVSRADKFGIMASLSNLKQSIKFQLLIDQLDDDEFDSFLSKLWRRNGKDTVLQLLRSNAENSIPQSELVSIVSNIITERDPPRRQLPTAGNIISETPSQLIGEIASFLDYSDYVYFSSTNRKMFVDCHSPNRLTKLNLSKFKEIDQSFSLANHPRLRYLAFNLSQITALNITGGVITRYCPMLRTLRLSGYKAHDDGVVGVHKIERFIADNAGNCKSITTLELVDFQNEDALDSQQLIRLLTEFPALIHLKMKRMESHDHCSIDGFRSLCPRISKLSMTVKGLGYSALLTAFSCKVQSLSLDSCKPPFQIPKNSDWLKLGTLRLYAPTKHMMDQILYKAKNLKRILFVPNHQNVDKILWCQMRNDEIEIAVENVIVNHPSLEFFYVSTRGHLERICNAIHRGLFRRQKNKKKTLTIVPRVEYTTECVALLSKILLTLSRSEIERWRVQIDMKGDLDLMAQAIRSFIAQHDEKEIKLLIENTRYLFIGNS